MGKETEVSRDQASISSCVGCVTGQECHQGDIKEAHRHHKTGLVIEYRTERVLCLRSGKEEISESRLLNLLIERKHRGILRNIDTRMGESLVQVKCSSYRHTIKPEAL